MVTRRHAALAARGQQRERAHVKAAPQRRLVDGEY
jgi:hypothetical protein